MVMHLSASAADVELENVSPSLRVVVGVVVAHGVIAHE